MNEHNSQEVGPYSHDGGRWGGVRVLDVRPVTQNMMSVSGDPACASNAISFGNDDGTSFIREQPPVDRHVETNLRFPVDGVLAEGVLFTPWEMEHKWAVFYHGNQILCVRSWLREVEVVAQVVEFEGYIEITEVHGVFVDKDEDPGFTIRMLDYLLRSHALNEVYPVPLPERMADDTQAAAMWCMSMFGALALVATPDEVRRSDPEALLRTHSLLHIAAAGGDTEAINTMLDEGMPVDLLAGDGLAPLHWALAGNDLHAMILLLDRGSPVDVLSDEDVTPLMMAVQSKNLEQVSILIDRGSDVNAHDGRGYTALHRAAEMGSFDIAKLLLKQGASLDSVAEGHTPRSLAEGQKETDILTLLDEYR